MKEKIDIEYDNNVVYGKPSNSADVSNNEENNLSNNKSKSKKRIIKDNVDTNRVILKNNPPDNNVENANNKHVRAPSVISNNNNLTNQISDDTSNRTKDNTSNNNFSRIKDSKRKIIEADNVSNKKNKSVIKNNLNVDKKKNIKYNRDDNTNNNNNDNKYEYENKVLNKLPLEMSFNSPNKAENEYNKINHNIIENILTNKESKIKESKENNNKSNNSNKDLIYPSTYFINNNNINSIPLNALNSKNIASSQNYPINNLISKDGIWLNSSSYNNNLSNNINNINTSISNQSNNNSVYNHIFNHGRNISIPINENINNYNNKNTFRDFYKNINQIYIIKMIYLQYRNKYNV